MNYSVLLSVAQMYSADRAAMAGGISGLALMEAAGAAVAREVQRRWPSGPVAILCGPGNNGGDGFVAARLLLTQGRDVRVALLGEREKLTGDARANGDLWTGPIMPLSPAVLDEAAIVVDGLFGAGLARPVENVPRETLNAIGVRQLPCLAIDVPSGVHGDSGAVLGFAPAVAATVTFFRRKTGHLLLPGRALCGEVVVADIGIPAGVLDGIGPQTWENGPELWRSDLPVPGLADHKYRRGMALLNGGAEMTGATRLAARGALRVGAGLVAVASPPEAGLIYRCDAPGLIVWDEPDVTGWRRRAEDPRVSALLLGPGNGVSDETRQRVLAGLGSGKAVVLDADALTVFQNDRAGLFGALTDRCVLTPHEGEYQRLFKHTGGKLERARAAAKESGAVVLLKGADTVIAAADGRAAINANAPADLATAGSGDVLAGFIAGLLAQGVPAFEAAGAGAWLHGAAGAAVGPGLIAEDLPQAMPPILRALRCGT